MVISFVVLTLILFGIIEMGWLFRDKGMLGNAARQAARSLAAGDSTSTATNKANLASAGLSNITYTFTDETVDSSGKVTSTSTLTDNNNTSPTTNAANPGDMIQVTAQYSHGYLTGVMGQKTVTLQSVVVMQREQ